MQRIHLDVGTLITRSLALLALCLATAGFIATLQCEANPAGDPHFKHGLQLSLQKKWPQAEAEYRKAIALDPKNATYHSYLADALAAQGKFDKAQNSYAQSEKFKKANPQSSVKKPPARKPSSTRPARTRPLSTRPSTSQPRPPQPGKSSSTSNTSRSQPGRPLPTPRVGGAGDAKAGRDKSGDGLPPAVFTLPDGTKVTVTGRPGQTITIPGQNGTNRDNAGNDTNIEDDPHYIKAAEYADDGKWPQAEAEYHAALKAHLTSTECWNGLGDVCFKQGKWQDAEKAHRMAVRLDPGESYFYAQLAHDLLKQNRKAEAMKEAKEAKRLGLEDHDVFDELGLGTE